ncbi:MAG: TatD family hydrolase [Myxococcales bacterium]|nr:TatD family hydrolase [Myxococcales bacterium]
MTLANEDDGGCGYFDAHCHLDSLSDVLDWEADASESGLVGFIAAGVEPSDWARLSLLAGSFEGPSFVAAGLHPWSVRERAAATRQLGVLAELLDGNEHGPDLIGEIGLDRSTPRGVEAFELQVEVFREQLAMARQRDMPVVIHSVRSDGRLIEVLSRDGLPRRGGMVHGFSGSPEVAERLCALGLYLSIGSTVVNPGATKVRAAVAAIPETQILIETDAPHRPPKGSEPPNRFSYLPIIGREVASLRAVSPGALASATARNALQWLGDGG